MVSVFGHAGNRVVRQAGFLLGTNRRRSAAVMGVQRITAKCQDRGFCHQVPNQNTPQKESPRDRQSVQHAGVQSSVVGCRRFGKEKEVIDGRC